jgi:hypothetical protein
LANVLEVCQQKEFIEILILHNKRKHQSTPEARRRAKPWRPFKTVSPCFERDKTAHLETEKAGNTN